MPLKIFFKSCRCTGCGGRRLARCLLAWAEFIEPRVLGVGYDTIHSLLRGELVGAAIIGLLVAKALVWSIALGSGTSGGVLAPLLIMGGALGAFVGSWIPVGDIGSLGFDRHGGDDGRHHAFAAHGDGFRR